MGGIYRQRGIGVQVMAFLGVLLLTPLIAWLVSMALGGLSTNAQVVIYLSFFLILFLGYGFWFARLGAKAFKTIGRRAFFARSRPSTSSKAEGQEGPLSVAGSQDRVALALQQTASAFFQVSIPVGVVSGFFAVFYASETGAWLRVTIVFVACLLWGLCLTNLARRGILPFPSDNQ